jgi:hypothetical protein
VAGAEALELGAGGAGAADVASTCFLPALETVKV